MGPSDHSELTQWNCTIWRFTAARKSDVCNKPCRCKIDEELGKTKKPTLTLTAHVHVVALECDPRLLSSTSRTYLRVRRAPRVRNLYRSVTRHRTRHLDILQSRRKKRLLLTPVTRWQQRQRIRCYHHPSVPRAPLCWDIGHLDADVHGELPHQRPVGQLLLPPEAREVAAASARW